MLQIAVTLKSMLAQQLEKIFSSDVRSHTKTAISVNPYSGLKHIINLTYFLVVRIIITNYQSNNINQLI